MESKPEGKPPASRWSSHLDLVARIIVLANAAAELLARLHLSL